MKNYTLIANYEPPNIPGPGIPGCSSAAFKLKEWDLPHFINDSCFSPRADGRPWRLVEGNPLSDFQNARQGYGNVVGRPVLLQLAGGRPFLEAIRRKGIDKDWAFVLRYHDDARNRFFTGLMPKCEFALRQAVFQVENLAQPEAGISAKFVQGWNEGLSMYESLPFETKEEHRLFFYLQWYLKEKYQAEIFRLPPRRMAVVFQKGNTRIRIFEVDTYQNFNLIEKEVARIIHNAFENML